MWRSRVVEALPEAGLRTGTEGEQVPLGTLLDKVTELSSYTADLGSIQPDRVLITYRHKGPSRDMVDSPCSWSATHIIARAAG